MTRCPRCRSTMLVDYDNAFGPWQATWKCLGCGKEVLQDAAARAKEEGDLLATRRERMPLHAE